MYLYLTDHFGRKKLKVSVLMYVKNGMPYFGRALTSVLNQTLRDIEIVVIDGGSTDGTLSLISQYQKKDKRIKYLHCGYGSVGAQFNLGLREAQGEYIGIVESDDYILPDMYETEYKAAKKNDCDVLRADNEIFFHMGGQEVRIRTRVSHDLSVYGRRLQASKDDERIHIGGSFWTGLYRRSYLLENRIFMNESRGAAYQDFGFLFLASALADSLYFLNEAFYCYRKDNPNSSCNRPKDIHMVSREYDFLKQQLISRGLWERLRKYYFLWRLRNEQWFCHNLNKEDKEQFLPYFYQDIQKGLCEIPYSEYGFNRKEERLICSARQSENAFCNYLRANDRKWKSACERLARLHRENSVYLFGAGNVGRIMHRYLACQNVEVKAYTDHNPNLWGSRIDGITVISPAQLLPAHEDIVLVCSENYADEIAEELYTKKIDESHIIICNDMDSCVRFLIESSRKAS